MNISKRTIPALLILVLSLSALRAQEMHRHDPTEKLGQVNFPVSCSAAAQKQFNRAMALQHSFQYQEAEEAFSEVSATDPSCAMCYWGVAMSNYHPLWTPPTADELRNGAAAIQRAKSLGARSQRERGS